MIWNTSYHKQFYIAGHGLLTSVVFPVPHNHVLYILR